MVPQSAKPILAEADDLVQRVAMRLDQIGCRVSQFLDLAL